MAATIACVTGGSGMIGRRIVSRLAARGYRVRALSRQVSFNPPGIETVRGALDDDEVLSRFVVGATLMFHCAAELNDEARMWPVNVVATERLLQLSAAAGIKHFSHMSSVGVVGKVKQKWVDEQTPCDPQNTYERSKYAAEALVARGIPGCATVILRPTDVVDQDRPGVLSAPRRRSWADVAKLTLTGGECAHIVHAEDVADAAMHLIDHSLGAVETFNVSCDHEPFNSLSELWPLFQAYRNGAVDVASVRARPYLPIVAPYLLRRALRETGNWGDVRYRADKLLQTGFKFQLGVKGAVRQIASPVAASGL